MSIQENIKEISKKISNKSEIIAVSKTFSINKIKEAHGCGIINFGENYLDEALEKVDQIGDSLNIKWHYLGRIQSKKINKMIGVFNYIHTLASLDHLRKIDKVAFEKGVKQNVLIQIKHIDDERSYGLNFEELDAFLSQGCELENINFSGVMFLPPQKLNSGELVSSFKDVSTLFNKKSNLCRSKGHSWDMISMGMSGDFEIAVKQGATHIRIGRGIFGDRD